MAIATDKERSPVLSVVFDRDDVERIDRQADREARKRSAMIRILVRESLDARERKQKPQR